MKKSHLEGSLTGILFFELFLGVLGLALARLFLDPYPQPQWSMKWNDLLWLIPPAVFPFFIIHDWAEKIPAMGEMEKVIRGSLLGKIIKKSHWVSFIFLALAAGLGEEVLFRYFFHPLVGLFGAAIIFGILHWLSLSYAVLATLLGLYFGWAFEQTHQNLWVPVLGHALYDFVALLLYKRRLTRS